MVLAAPWLLRSYDAHIHLYGYPFLDSKEEFTHNTLACDVMRPRKRDPPLTVIDLSKVTIGSLQQLLEESEYFGFPCVLSTESQQLAGFLTRKDIQTLLGEFLLLSHMDNGMLFTVICCSQDVCLQL